ncbi:hypothetical protein C3432_11755 [Citrobacter amalonaticus]|uniref:Fimbrial protein n=1 Tax=Citrobacter amalonaticus TaxID=35703 RepID=A0A2S4RPZ5_CITAM|nr:hypothetical protein [Citrobacter amalonaticus]POT58550.1 hypothetical protein C3432_11755 [Citrobacter amalonaticus]POT75924.1 hypothetical protein C3436_00060 [Citrobacter amalonaticus]POU59114.1 hypothetical protein C3430_26940 [Citrobacter amalonaticus]POV05159.1 hypothetical protein C3424_07365 [Citrobacter amalonaticus]
MRLRMKLSTLALLSSLPLTCHAETEMTCTPAQSEVKGTESAWSVYNGIIIGPWENSLAYTSSTIPGTADLTALKNAITQAFTSDACVNFGNGVTFTTINYVPSGYTFNVGTHATGYTLRQANNQANITMPAGWLNVSTWVTMKPKPFQVKLPTLLNGNFTVTATGLLGYFWVSGSAATGKRYDAAITFNCTASSQPELRVSPVEIDFGTVSATAVAPVVDRALTVTVPQAGVSGQVGIEFISSTVTEGTRVSLGHSWVEILNPVNGSAVPVSTVPGQNGVLLTQDVTNFTVRLHPIAGSNGAAESTLILNVVWL